jgi:hypothetical protein
VAEAQLLKHVAKRVHAAPGVTGAAGDRGPARQTSVIVPFELTRPGRRASILLALALAAWPALAASVAGAQTCLRPQWTECISFPNGGRHTGVSPHGKPVQLDVPQGAKICVSTEWEIRAENYVLFERDGHAWPDRDWEVEAETFCFFRN